MAKTVKQLVTDLANEESLFNDFVSAVRAGDGESWHREHGYEHRPRVAAILAEMSWDELRAIRDRRDKWDEAEISDTLKAQMV